MYPQIHVIDRVYRSLANAVVDREPNDLQRGVAGMAAAFTGIGVQYLDRVHRETSARCVRRRATGVNPSWGRRDRPVSLAALRDSPAARRRGLMNSSMPKLISARLVPSSAMQTPAGMYHHHWPLGDGLTLGGVEQDRAPTPAGRRIQHTEEAERDVRSDGVEHGEQERRGEDRDQVGHHLEDDDAPGRLAADPGRFDEVAVAQRQRLGPKNPGPPGPAGGRDDGSDQQIVGRLTLGQEASDHDQQRQRRQHQKYVGQHGQEVVDETAQVAGGDADDDRQHRGDRAGQERHHQRRPRAHQQLGQMSWPSWVWPSQ